MTKKELIEALAEFPDDILLIAESEEGDYFTLCNPVTVSVHISNQNIVERHVTNSFCGCWACSRGYELKNALLLG